MGDKTAIEWCDATHNGWIGCTEVSTAESGGGGCDNCYARTLDARHRWGGATHWGPGVPRMRTSAANWKKPIRWNRLAEEGLLPDGETPTGGRRPRVFCHSLADVFDNEVPEQWRDDLVHLIADTPNLDWLLLTKRIGNAARMMQGYWPMPNVWLGITVVNQMEADRDIPKLLATPARVRFLSCEPLLGPIDIAAYLPHPDAIGGSTYNDGTRRRCDLTGLPVDGIDWVISGGESGPKARPSHPDWHRDLRDQCAAAGVPFFLKQITERGRKVPYETWPADLRMREFPNA